MIPPQNLPATEEPPLARPNDFSRPPNRMSDGFDSVPVPRRLWNGGAEPAAWNVPAINTAASPATTPTVSITVTAPESIKAGELIVYKLTVENRSSAAAHHVLVSNAIPANASFVKAAPEPTENRENILRWRLGTLEPRAQRVIELSLQPTGDGDVSNVARVRFEHGEQVMTRVRGPQLSLRRFAASHAHENEAIPCRLVVENTGVVSLHNIVLRETVSEGLEHEGNERGSATDRSWDIGSLKPGEHKDVTYTLIAKRAGKLSSVAVVTDGKTRSESKFSVDVGKAEVQVALTGPDKGYAGQSTTMQAVVRNSGSIPLDNVAVVYHLPPGVSVQRASQDSESFKDRVQWNISRLEVGGTRTYRIDVIATKTGLTEHRVAALAKGSQSSSRVVTDYLGAIGLRLAVIESADPGRKGAALTYTLRVQNTGKTTAENVVLKVDYPIVLMEFQRASIPHKFDKDKNRIILDSITVRGGETITVTLSMSALQSGIARMHVEMSGADLDSARPVIVEEVTTITE
jgi:uncharacterized repeat protein (TIGR01451 family)